MATDNGWELVGTIGVDGAHVLVGDANYAEKLSRQWKEQTGHGQYEEFVIDRMAHLNYGYAEGFACVSGDGDGSYRVYVKHGKSKLGEHKIITHLLVDFTKDDDD